MQTNEAKNQQAITIIASEIAKLPANTPGDHGTLAASRGMTQREAKAYSMALYIVQRLYGITLDGRLPENYTADQKDASALVDQIANAAVGIAGK